ncbi:hypothetical protein [Petropleomorpha daqingensis]|uniref:Uncharacterized protein n=1 Tax=Petropleomorpha daqingensis TaxID=2026353 RepID=A0A853CKF9_9ACTN|nr:hypothetical protein [Petropleomorpha daqingensis]NYJ07022.1 hypothetical protein [Petropleomorpha daqingensis]
MKRPTSRSRWAVGTATVALLLAPALAALIAFRIVVALLPDDVPPPAHWTTAGSP